MEEHSKPGCTRIQQSLCSLWEFMWGDEVRFPSAPALPFKGLSQTPLPPLAVGADPRWEPVNLPHCFNADELNREKIPSSGQLANGAGAGFAGYGSAINPSSYYRGPVWYRRFLSLPECWSTRRLFLRFEGVNQSCTLFLNGREVGRHHGGYTAFCFEITGDFQFGGDNWIHIRVTNAHDEEVLPTGGDLGHFGGIYRPVHLLATSSVHFDCLHYGGPGVYVDASTGSDKEWMLRVSARIANDSASDALVRLVSLLRDPNGLEVLKCSRDFAQAAGDLAEIEMDSPPVPAPALWSPGNPALYRVEHRLETADGTLLDSLVTPLGFRSLAVDAQKGFLLNGSRLPIRGIGRHQDSAGRGYATPREVLLQDTRRIKEMGANFQRAHYPLPLCVTEECDRLGLLSWVKIPVMDKTGSSEAYLQNAVTMLREMVWQHYNHPSVALWGFACEALGDADWFWPKPVDPARLKRHFRETRDFMRAMRAEIRAVDTSRPVCNDFHTDPNVEWYRDSGLLDLDDLNGWNIYQGWYHGSLATIGGVLDMTRLLAPSQPYLIAEFGAGTDTRVHSYEPTIYDMSPEHAGRLHTAYLEVAARRPWLAGMFVWTLADFQRTSIGDTMHRINNKGMLTSDRRVKDTFYLYKAHWNPEPMVRIAEHDWSCRADVSSSDQAVIPITIYSNLPEVELIHNGITLGRRQPVNRSATWEVPCVHGANVIEATGKTRTGLLQDRMLLQMNLFPEPLSRWKRRGEMLGLNIGNERCHLHDPALGQCWLPDRPHRAGAFGHIGGRCYRHWPAIPAWEGIRDGVRDHIHGTSMVPLFQTFRIGIEEVRFDAADGLYEVTLGFCEPFDEAARKDPGNPTGADTNGRRIFSVSINGTTVLDKLDPAGRFGPRIAISESFVAEATGGKGLSIRFHPLAGEPILSAAGILRI